MRQGCICMIYVSPLEGDLVIFLTVLITGHVIILAINQSQGSEQKLGCHRTCLIIT